MKAEMAVQMNALRQQMTTKDSERKQDTAALRKLEKELDDLRKVMAAKTSEDSKRQEADRSRESEMGRLREQVVSLQKALDNQRDGAQQLANKLRVDVEGLRQNHNATQRDLQAAQAALQKKEDALAQLQKELTRADDSKRQVTAELSAVRGQIDATDRKLKDAVQGRDVSIRECFVLDLRCTGS